MSYDTWLVLYLLQLQLIECVFSDFLFFVHLSNFFFVYFIWTETPTKSLPPLYRMWWNLIWFGIWKSGVLVSSHLIHYMGPNKNKNRTKWTNYDWIEYMFEKWKWYRSIYSNALLQ